LSLVSVRMVLSGRHDHLAMIAFAHRSAQLRRPVERQPDRTAIPLHHNNGTKA
jgi:hypothetical protein